MFWLFVNNVILKHWASSTWSPAMYFNFSDPFLELSVVTRLRISTCVKLKPESQNWCQQSPDLSRHHRLQNPKVHWVWPLLKVQSRVTDDGQRGNIWSLKNGSLLKLIIMSKKWWKSRAFICPNFLIETFCFNGYGRPKNPGHKTFKLVYHDFKRDLSCRKMCWKILDSWQDRFLFSKAGIILYKQRISGIYNEN